MAIIEMERKRDLEVFGLSLVGVSFASCTALQGHVKNLPVEENSSTRGGFCLGPHAAQFNEACRLLAGFRLAATPRHCLSLGRTFLGAGLNLLPSCADLVVVCFLHTPIYRASAKLLNY